jgi:precorrin-6B methylase 1
MVFAKKKIGSAIETTLVLLENLGSGDDSIHQEITKDRQKVDSEMKTHCQLSSAQILFSQAMLPQTLQN